MKIPSPSSPDFSAREKPPCICNLLKQSPDRRLAILVNEFGEVSVDGALLRTAGGECGVEIHDLPNGCICCTVQDDFLPDHEAASGPQARDRSRADRNLRPRPADAGHAGLAWPEIRNDFQLDAVLTVVDTPQLLAGKLESGEPIPGGTRRKPPLTTKTRSIPSSTSNWKTRMSSC